MRRVVARAVHGAGDAGPARVQADLADVDALLPADDAGRRAGVGGADGAGRGGLHGPRAALRGLPGAIGVRVGRRRAGRAYDGPRRAVQAFAGPTGRSAGRLLEVLRGSPEPVERPLLDAAWADAAQRAACLDSLLVDGLAEQLDDGRFALPGISPRRHGGRAHQGVAGHTVRDVPGRRAVCPSESRRG